MDLPPNDPRTTSGAPDPEALVRRVAALARLDVDREEARTLGPQFARILELLRGLEALDVEGVEPLTRPGDRTDVVRADDPRASASRELLLRLAPDAREGFYAVPKTLGDAT